jgi:hypothetical protein
MRKNEWKLTVAVLPDQSAPLEVQELVIQQSEGWDLCTNTEIQ